MIESRQRRRGQPVLYAALVLATWSGARFVLWENPFPSLVLTEAAMPSPLVSAKRVIGKSRPDEPLSQNDPGPHGNTRILNFSVEAWLRQTPVNISVAGPIAVGPIPSSNRTNAPLLQSRSPELLPTVIPLRHAAASTRPSGKRWHVDSWLLWRDGSSERSLVQPGYLGSSQAGVSLSYDLRPSSSISPKAYARVSKALVANGEFEGALGLSARPVSRLPVALHAEVRSLHFGGRSEIRPAIFATAGVHDEPLPAGILARGYAQAGYVGGKYATGFADGQLVLHRPLAKWRENTFSLGGGTWGSVQQGLGRIDVGPTASVDLYGAGVPLRVSADYRFRVAGQAEPGSGPAVTVSSSF